MNINPLTAIDFYKSGHFMQYPDGTTEIYSNFTARSSINESFGDYVIFFGLQYFIKEFLIESWGENFFKKEKEIVVKKYKRIMDYCLGINSIDIYHIELLHDIGYLPIKIKALEEGSKVNLGIPLLTIVNTHPDFYWLTNYIETVMSSYLWKMITNATIAFKYKLLLNNYAKETGCDLDFIKFQAHDFSFRGMSGLQDAAMSGAAHLTSFCGTDSIPAIELLEEYYCANIENELVGCSVPATEHSVMCMGGNEFDQELNTFRRLICDIYPKGIVSIVSDTWNFWGVIDVTIRKLKKEIIKRKGKIVIRPDSGDPVDIICGDDSYRNRYSIDYLPENRCIYKGAVECLWDIFGGTITEKGYKLLDKHIGLIYGDSITLEKAERILKRLKEKGFSSGNIVFGVGSYTYQYNTRDTYGFAIKSTSGVVNGERKAIYKKPVTDNGRKNSAKGLLRVERTISEFILFEDQTEEQEDTGELKTVFYNGKLVREVSLKEIRENINSEIETTNGSN